MLIALLIQWAISVLRLLAEEREREREREKAEGRAHSRVVCRFDKILNLLFI